MHIEITILVLFQIAMPRNPIKKRKELPYSPDDLSQVVLDVIKVTDKHNDYNVPICVIYNIE